MHNRFFYKLLIFALVILYHYDSKAICECKEMLDVSSAVLTSNSVFVGQVENIIWINPFDYIVKFDKSRIWKGNKQPYKYLISTISNKECGYKFTIGNEYLVYAYTVQNIDAVSKCGRTKLLQQTEKDEFKKLGKPLWRLHK